MTPKRAVSLLAAGALAPIRAIQNRRDLTASRAIDVSGCRSVCLTLGPYRNLTTLTAATLFLHPECQVLNHAGRRIYGQPEVNFFTDFSPQKLDRFVQFATQISTRGTRGDHGGSIIHSHAFDRKHDMERFRAEARANLRKSDIRCLFWKESLMTSNYIRDQGIDLCNIFAQDQRLRFLLPIRNPMDCAVSNIKTGHVARLKGLSSSASPAEVVIAILDLLSWFVRLRGLQENRFFSFFEHSVSIETVTHLAEFLELEPHSSWIANALAAMKFNSRYKHSTQLKSHYCEQVHRLFADDREMREGLLHFL